MLIAVSLLVEHGDHSLQSPDCGLHWLRPLVLKLWRIGLDVLQSCRAGHADQLFHRGRHDSCTQVLPVKDVLSHCITVRVLPRLYRPAFAARLGDQFGDGRQRRRGGFHPAMHTASSFDLRGNSGAYRGQLIHIGDRASTKVPAARNYPVIARSVTTRADAVAPARIARISRTAEDYI